MDLLFLPIQVRVVTEIVLHSHIRIHIHIPRGFLLTPSKSRPTVTLSFGASLPHMGRHCEIHSEAVIAREAAFLDFRLSRDRSRVIAPAASLIGALLGSVPE